MFRGRYEVFGVGKRSPDIVVLLIHFLQGSRFRRKASFQQKFLYNIAKRRTEQGKEEQSSGAAMTTGDGLSGPSSLTFLSIYDGLDVSVTSSIIWFRPNHDIVPRLICTLIICGEHSITREYENRSWSEMLWHEVVTYEESPHTQSTFPANPQMDTSMRDG